MTANESNQRLIKYRDLLNFEAELINIANALDTREDRDGNTISEEELKKKAERGRTLSTILRDNGLTPFPPNYFDLRDPDFKY